MNASTTAASAATQKMNVAAHAVAAAMAALIYNAATLTAAYIEKLRNPSCSNVGITAQPVTPPKSNSHRNPQSLARGARSTSRGTVLPNQAIGVYGKTGLTDMASCCRCTTSVRGLAVIVNIGAHAPCQ